MKQQKKINNIISKKNAALEGASPAEKRVMIAKDVLKLLKLGKIKPEFGTWCEVTNSDNIDNAIEKLHGHPNDSFEYPDNLKFELSSVIRQVNCNVCGLGALFVASVDVFNKLELRVDDYYNNAEISFQKGEKVFDKTLGKYFSESQLQLIEFFFESGRGAYQLCVRNKTEDIFINFSGRDPKDKLTLIMKNIIANNGTFVPEKLPVRRELVSKK